MVFNGMFSLASGLLLAILPGTVDDWLGFSAPGWLRLVGLGLIGHAAILFWAARRPDPAPWARLNLLAIAPYPLLMIGLVATGVIDRQLGQGLALIDGAIIAGIAGWHWASLRESRQVPQPRMA